MSLDRIRPRFVLSRRALAASVMVGAAALALPLPAMAEIKKLDIIAPANPGGGWDQTARAMQSALQADKLASGVQVENIGGAGGTIGLAQFVSSRGKKGDAVLVGGGPVPSELLGRAQEAGVRVVTSYGMSETCGGCVYDGTALRGVGVRIEAGRVVLSGPMLFAGYRLRPDLTAQALLDGELFTADRGELVAGRLRVLGRLDDVVISGGVNVDLAAVQRRLDALGGGAVAVFGVPDAEWGTRVVALTEGDWDASALRAALVGHFEPAALPKAVRRVRVLPRTATGKIDRRALAASWREVDRWRA